MRPITALPLMYQYEPDVEIVDDPFHPGNPRVVTRVMGDVVRPPAPPLFPLDRFPVVNGLYNGARVDLIADSIANGERWIVGPAAYSGPSAIWLTPIELPYRDQVAAWRARGPR